MNSLFVVSLWLELSSVAGNEKATTFVGFVLIIFIGFAEKKNYCGMCRIFLALFLVADGYVVDSPVEEKCHTVVELNGLI